jgi:hypothetical protein
MHKQADREAWVLRMAEALRTAAAGADWARLDEHARALAPQLRALAERGPWSAAERAALLRLRQAHDDAAQAASAATDALAQKLEALRTNKAGWIAYAMHSETETATNQA